MGKRENTEYVPSRPDGLLVIIKQNEEGDLLHTVYHHEISYQEFFRYDWPKGAKIVDNRDAMHRRGWTYFRIEGNVEGVEVSGTGRLPFVYQAVSWYPPWLRLRVDGKDFVDVGGGFLSRAGSY